MEQFLLTAGGSSMGSFVGNKLPVRGKLRHIFYLFTLVFLGCGLTAAASPGNMPVKKTGPGVFFTKVARRAAAKMAFDGPTCLAISATDPNPTSSSIVNYTVTFSDDVTGVDETDFTVSGDSYAGIAVTPLSASVYTVTIWGITTSGYIQLDLNNMDTGIEDLSGNPIIGGFTGGDIYIITMGPGASGGSFSTSNTVDNSFAKLGDVVTLDFIADEAIQTPVITIGTHTVTAVNVSGNEWVGSYTVTSSDPEGEMDFDIVLTDFSGLSNEFNTANTGLMVTVDLTPPTISIGNPSVSATSSGPVTYNVTYTDDNFNSSTLSTSDITLNTTGTANGTVSVSSGGPTATVTISNISGVGTLGISVGPNTAIDEAGNQAPAAASASATFTVLPSSDATLSNILVSSGVLVPAFSSTRTSYTDQVINANSSIYLTITPSNSGASIVVNGMPVTNGVQSSAIPLSVGTNTLTIVVTAGDGVTTDTYTLSVKRPISTNANLGSIAVTPTATLVGTTGPGYLNFNANVANTVSSIQVTPTTADATATVKVNGVAVTSGSLSQPIALPVGTTVITTVITAQDGSTTKTVIINVTRPTSSDATLAALSASGATLSPGFVSTTTSYTATVPYTTSSITLTPTVNFASATVSVNGTPVTSGTASGSIPLNVGANAITTVVTAQNGTTTKTYTSTITRTAPSTNALLSSIALSPTETLVGTTGPGYLNFTVSVPNSVSSIQVIATAKDPTATITVNGANATSGVASSPVALAAGSNTITTVLTAQDGVTTKTVIITITRAASSNANLSYMAVGGAAISPAFATATTSYTASVPYTTTSVTVTPTASDATATITVNGNTVASGSASAAVPLSVGTNTITTLVTAQNGTTTKTYTTTITRQLSTNALLANISTTPTLTLVGATGPGYLNFTATAQYGTTSIQVIPVAKDSTATIKVNGTTVASGAASQPIALNIGANTITTVITAQDGVTTKTIIITVTRLLSSNASLSGLTATGATLSPSFVSTVLRYTATVPYLTTSFTLTPTVADPNATVMVNGTPITSGATTGPIALNVGLNTITTVVTAPNGTTVVTYTTSITRSAPSSNAQIATISVLPKATLVGATGPGYLNFTANVPNSVSSMQVLITLKDTTATFTVNGVAATSGVASQAINLPVGATTITAVITAQDNVTTKSVIITVNRAVGSLDSYYQPQQISVSKPADSLSMVDDGILVHQAVSPNGDGINDHLTIDGITNYPVNRLMIVDRNGNLVYQATGYDNSTRVFDGHSSNGRVQQAGTYFYSLEYTVNGETRRKTGYIELRY